jgi:hypothetical protein
MNQFILSKSDKPQKKYKITFINPTTNRVNKLYFGASGYQSFTDRNDENRKARYLQRHTEPSDNPYKPAFWATNLLWNQPTISKSIADIEKRYKIKIINSI